MKNCNKATATTPLRHFPYQGPLTPAESPLSKPNDLMEDIKKEEMQSPEKYQHYHHHQQQQQLHHYQPYYDIPSSRPSTPSPTPSDQHPYTCPSIPHSASSSSGYHPSDIPLNRSGPYPYYGRGRMSDDEEENEDYEEKKAKIQKVQKVNGQAQMKPARKYSQRSENEKNTLEYKQSRARNNEAVRRSRARSAKIQHEKDLKMAEMEKEIEELNNVVHRLQQAHREKDNLIRRAQVALQKYGDPSIFKTIPVLGDIAAYRS